MVYNQYKCSPEVKACFLSSHRTCRKTKYGYMQISGSILNKSVERDNAFDERKKYHICGNMTIILRRMGNLQKIEHKRKAEGDDDDAFSNSKKFKGVDNENQVDEEVLDEIIDVKQRIPTQR